MIFFLYGSRSTKGKPVETDEACPSCGAKHSVFVYPFYEYFHIFWVPFCPMSKSIVVGCIACGSTFNVDKKNLNNAIKSQIKRPVWHFIGLVLAIALLSLFFTWLWGVKVSTNNKLDSYIENPEIGDIYEAMPADGKYTLMKVAAISGDTIFLRFNKYTVDNQFEGLRELREGYMDSFTLETSLYLKEDLKKKVRQNVIIDIERNNYTDSN